MCELTGHAYMDIGNYLAGNAAHSAVWGRLRSQGKSNGTCLAYCWDYLMSSSMVCVCQVN